MIDRATQPSFLADLPRDDAAMSDWARRLVLVAFGSSAGLRILRDIAYPFHVGFDARLYTDASRVWLSGGDPWRFPYEYGIYYAAPPPSLLVTAPLTLLPSWLAGLVVVVVSAVLALAAIRSLRLPAYWILFAPILDGVLVGSLDIATLALLVLARGRLSALAPLCKVYAFVPIVGQRQGRQCVAAIALFAATAPLLPWATFVNDLPLIQQALVTQAASTSVWGQPVVWVALSLAMLTLGLRRAGWLAVPVLWPSTQPHYAALALPVVATSVVLTVGFTFAFLIPWSPPVAVALYVAARLADDRRPTRMADALSRGGSHAGRG